MVFGLCYLSHAHALQWSGKCMCACVFFLYAHDHFTAFSFCVYWHTVSSRVGITSTMSLALVIPQTRRTSCSKVMLACMRRWDGMMATELVLLVWQQQQQKQQQLSWLIITTHGTGVLDLADMQPNALLFGVLKVRNIYHITIIEVRLTSNLQLGLWLGNTQHKKQKVYSHDDY